MTVVGGELRGFGKVLPGAPDAAVLRRAVWKDLNRGGHAGTLDAAQSRALAWLEKASRTVSAF